MEHHICDVIALRMKHRKASWSIRGREHLAKILTTKIGKDLYDKVTNISKIMLPERYEKEITEILSIAKTPKKEGKGYKYPAIGKTLS